MAVTGLREIKALKRRFMALNRDRLERTRDSLSARQVPFLDLLPLIFHVNHPLLPGFITKDSPRGISDYSPSARSIKAANKLAKSFYTRKRALLHYDIYSIFIMGSSGTIAHSDASDFDVWICHRPDTPPVQLSELRQKATAVELWAAGLGVTAHFFLMDAESFKAGERVTLSSESSGSAQHHLLLEEFYRTSLLLAGRYPLWWMVPVEYENDYDHYVQELLRKGFIRNNEYVDFGALPTIPPAEFFGAALWQLYKAIDSPYKSLLKMFLMETYAQEYPHGDLLSRRFKYAVYEGEKNLSHLDPYVMLYQKIEDHFRARNDDERINLLRRCFYFKVNERISSLDMKVDDTEWRRAFIVELLRRWEWTDADLRVLNTRPQWKISQVSFERNVLVNELTNSYTFLSNFARDKGELSAIDQRDLNILGRKLFAAFERRAEKIEIINHGISDNLWESHLSVHQVSNRDGHSSWVIYRGTLNADEAARETPLKRAYSVVELLAWCHFNGLVDNRTILTLLAREGGATVKEIYGLVDVLQRLFPAALLKETNMAVFENAPRPLVTAIFANVGIDPMYNRTRDGKMLTSNKTDALSYSGLNENLVVSLDQVVVTSWQEVEIYRYSGADCIFDCLCDYYRRVPPSRGVPLPRVSAHSFSSMRGATIGSRIEQLFADVIDNFYKGINTETRRYVIRSGNSFVILRKNAEALEYQRVGNLDPLYLELARGRPVFSPIAADRFALTDTVLPNVFDANRPDVIQLFLLADASQAMVYVADERGSIYFEQRVFHRMDSLVNQFMLFFDAIAHRREIHGGYAGTAAPVTIPVICYEITRSKKSGVTLRRIDTDSMRAATGFFSVKVIGNAVANSDLGYTIFCEDREFSSLEFGADVFRKVAAHITRLRDTTAAYPIYITDIDIPGTVLGADPDGHVQTIHYLNYKKQIEDQLNRALGIASDSDRPANIVDRLMNLVRG
ncbi:MAG: adenylate cyclase class 1 [Gammaproteobacteria bacterium]|nr:MAG: adenylate cyclase class 1 [Gammaproteobacteria bacterium]TND06428.1 MAG: adenylate cyclase, class 1 [Gammaproteobacteria bacterium]